jgi:hypothetical protein
LITGVAKRVHCALVIATTLNLAFHYLSPPLDRSTTAQRRTPEYLNPIRLLPADRIDAAN